MRLPNGQRHTSGYLQGHSGTFPSIFKASKAGVSKGALQTFLAVFALTKKHYIPLEVGPFPPVIVEAKNRYFKPNHVFP